MNSDNSESQLINTVGTELRFMIGNMSVELINLRAQLNFAQNYIRELEERLVDYDRGKDKSTS